LIYVKFKFNKIIKSCKTKSYLLNVSLFNKTIIKKNVKYKLQKKIIDIKN